MKGLKRLIPLFVVLIAALCMSACGDTAAVNNKLPVFSARDTAQFDRAVYRKNDLALQMKNPHVMYVQEGVGEGKYVLYGNGTSAGVGAISAYTSENLSDWKPAGVAFAPLRTSWVKDDCFSPMVVFDSAEKLYYMYYGAVSKETQRECYGIGVAVSASPYGPFTEFEGTDRDGRVIRCEDQTIDCNLPLSLPENERLQMRDPYLLKTQDAMYLYFSDGADIWTMEMADYVTPRFSTLKKVARYGNVSVDGASFDKDADGIALSPCVLRVSDKYVLSYSTGKGNNYSVCYAFSDKPDEGFVKQDAVLAADYNDSGNDGHGIFQADGKYVITYSTNDANIPAGVCFASISVSEKWQAAATRKLLPALIGDNLADRATVTELDETERSAVTDNDAATFVTLPSGARTLTFTFDGFTAVNALFVSANASKIEKIILRTDKSNLNAFSGYVFDGSVVIQDLAVVQGVAFAQFQRLQVKEIQFVFTADGDCDVFDVHLLQFAV